jgi:hypothetical protein
MVAVAEGVIGVSVSGTEEGLDEGKSPFAQDVTRANDRKNSPIFEKRTKIFINDSCKYKF